MHVYLKPTDDKKCSTRHEDLLLQLIEFVSQYKDFLEENPSVKWEQLRILIKRKRQYKASLMKVVSLQSDF